MPRWAKVVLGVLGALLLLVGIGVFVLTQTDYGRGKVRDLALSQLRSSVHGRVRIGKIQGNLLSGATIDRVVITDSAGAPFFRADTVAVDYSLGSLLRKRIALSNLRLVDPEIVLNRPPGGAWNFARIFPSDTTKPPNQQGFGAWVTIRDLTVRGGHVLVRNAWTPPDTLAGAARDSAISVALSPDSRLRVVRVPGGFQSVQEYRRVNARLPRLRLADPDSAAIVVDVAHLSALAFPFRPPAARVQDLAGRLVKNGDTLTFENVRAALPSSRLALEGTYGIESGAVDVRVRGAPVAFADLQWAYPPLPDTGGGVVDVAFVRDSVRSHLVARRLDLHLEGARLAGHADVAFGDSLRLGDTDLRFAGVSTALIRRFAPDVTVPREGVLEGRVALAGSPAALRLDGRVAFDDRRGGVSRVFADGRIGTEGGFRAQDLRIRLAPVQVALARTFRPDLPIGGTVTGDVVLDGAAEDLRLRADLVHNSARTGRSEVLARGAVVKQGDSYAARELTLRFAPVQVALARAFRPDLALGGTLTGAATLNGAAEDLRLRADLVHNSARTGRSELLADGELGLGEVFRARNLRLRFQPVQVALARAFNPQLPVGGTISGQATVNGSTATRFAVDANLTHRARTGVSRVVGDVTVGFGDPRRFDADLRFLPLSLNTAGLFAPSAGLHGSVAGTLRARGTLRDLALALRLDVANGGSVSAGGNFDVASARKRYDLTARFADFDARALSERAPETRLTGTFAARGRGTDPATLNALLSANLTGVRVDSVGADSVRLLARLADGLAVVRQGTVRLASATAEVSGSFGLVANRRGELTYRVRVDSLSDFARYLPADTTADTVRVRPRPVEVARAIRRAREDSTRIARATEVERAATGRPADPTLRVDTASLRRDSLSGSFAAEGRIAGNPQRFDLRGTATLDQVVALGNTVGSGRIGYTWIDAPTPRSDLALTARLDSVRASGFALDTVGLRARYRGGRETGTGTFDVGVQQDSARDYRLRADFALTADQKEVRLADVLLRLDTTRWRSAHPGAVAWGGRGVEIQEIELRSDDGARIYANGRLPGEGPSDFHLEVQRLQVGDLLALLQDTARVRGRLSLVTDVRGTRASPRITGTAALVEASVDTVALPALNARFAYADRELQADADLRQNGRVLLTADGRVPIDLAFSGVTGPRFAADAPISLDVRADSLPLEALPSFTTAVANVQGRLVGQVAVRGTRANPDARGMLKLDLGSMKLVTPGLALRDIAGTLRIQGDTVAVDSLVATSNGGPIRVAGTLDIAKPTEPTFDLRLVARGAQVLNNEQGDLLADADLALVGPWTGARVGGDIRILHGVIYAPEAGAVEPIDLTQPPALPVAERIDPAALPEPNPLLANLRVDVNVVIEPSTWVRNSAANVEIYTPRETGALVVNVDRSAGALTLRGVVNTDRGEYAFASRRFQVTRGAISFLGDSPIDPLLQLTAENQVKLPDRPALNIVIVVAGTLREPTVTLQSDAQPPISQSDLLSYLAFGESSSSLLQFGGSGIGGQSGGGGGLTGQVGALATKQLTATAVGVAVQQAEQGATRELGLDVFHITPSPLLSELAFNNAVLKGTELEVGKYLSNRWFLAAQGRPALVVPGLRLEYRTPGGFRWVTSYEPRFFPQQPSLTAPDEVDQRRVFGLFLLWNRRY